MATEKKYILPQKRDQGNFRNIEKIHKRSMTPNNINKNQDRLVETYDSSSGWLLRDTTQEITSFDAARLDIGSETVVSNTDAELLCTYNWISSKPSAIFVPGAPPAWSPKKLPITLPMDPGLFCPQQAAYKPPEYPYEPLYQALSIMNPEIDFNATHLVTNRRCLQMLFNFASGITFQDFRIDLHMVHKTLFLTRRTKKRYLVAHADGTTKIGSNFESAFTKSESGLEDSSSHHRVVGYSLGDLKCVVRFEADACYEKENEGPQVMDKRRVDFFSSLSGEELRAKCEQVSSSAEPKIAAAAAAAADVSPHTSVVLGGRIVSSSSMAELKTYQGSHFYMDKHLPQLWFGRTSNLLVGNHINGTFHKLEAINVARQLLKWERMHQKVLRKLVWLITKLHKIAQGRTGGCCVLVGKGKAKRATVYGAAKQTSVLPDYIVKKFWRKERESEQNLLPVHA